MAEIQHDSAIFTREEALSFLVKNFEMSDPMELLSKDPLRLLHQISGRYSETLPLQNISILHSPIQTICVPCLKKIKADRLAGRGGMCYGNNVFLCELLCALGYKAHVASASVVVPNDHIVVIVKAMPDGTSDTLYFLDNGFALPLQQAVPVNFETESPVYNLGHTIFKITKEGDVYSRFAAKHGKLFVSASDFESNDKTIEWTRCYTFSTKPSHIRGVEKGMEFSYQERFSRQGNLLFTIVRGNVLHWISDFDRSTAELNITYHKMSPSVTVSTKLDAADDIVRCFRDIFPGFTCQELMTAVENLANYKRTFVLEHGTQWFVISLWAVLYGPLTRYVKVWDAHAPGMSGTFFPPPTLKETAS